MADVTSTDGKLDADHINEVPGSPREGEKYAVESGNGGEWHIYPPQDGNPEVKEWVADPPISSTGGTVAPASTAPMTVTAAPAPVSTTPSAELPIPGTAVTAAPAPVSTTPSAELPIPGTAVTAASPPAAPAPTDNPLGIGVTPPAPTGVNGIGGSAASGPVSNPSPAPTDNPLGMGITATVLPSDPGSGTVGTPSDGNIVIHHSEPTAVGPADDSSAGGPHVGEGASVSPADSTTGGSTYTVKSGDTLSGIAEAHGMTLSQLEALNQHQNFSGNFDLIHPGDTVNLSAGSAAPATSSDNFGPTSTETIGPKGSSYNIVPSTPLTASNTSVGGGWAGGEESVDPIVHAMGEAGKADSNPFKVNENDHH